MLLRRRAYRVSFLIFSSVSSNCSRTSDAGLYLVAAISGLTDVDAITLSISRMVKMGEIDISRAWRLILIAYVANLLFKIGIVAAVGSRHLLARVALLFGMVGAVSAAVVLFYPRT